MEIVGGGAGGRVSDFLPNHMTSVTLDPFI
jgi:hypothetical protein